MTSQQAKTYAASLRDAGASETRRVVALQIMAIVDQFEDLADLIAVQNGEEVETEEMI